MKSIFKTLYINGAPSLPAMEDLQWDDNGTLRGGYSMMEEVPPADPNTKVQVQVEANEATINSMKENPEYEWIEDIVEYDIITK